ncbi:MAG: M24 family metallopeptidase [Desulfurivibrionaceae bacterium]
MKTSHYRIKQSLKQRRLDAVLIASPENRRYLSGFSPPDGSLTETSGWLLIPAEGGPCLLTDPRFRLEAEKEAPDFRTVIYSRSLLSSLRDLLKEQEIRQLAFESRALLHSTYLELADKLSGTGIEITPLENLVERMRLRKGPGELEKIKASVRLNEEVFQEAYQRLEPGMTEIEVALDLERTMRLKGAEGPSFPTIVAGGPSGAAPHAVPGGRPLREGEPVIIDMGLILDGYCSDMSRTIILGKPDRQTTERIRLVRRAQQAAIQVIRAGIPAREVDRTARSLIADEGMGNYFNHGLGHGVGLAVHEAPSLNRRNRKKLREGMVVTVEPGIYIQGWGGIRLENMVVVKKDGCEVLNRDTIFLDL